MDTLTKEIEKFITFTTYSPDTKKRYKKYLMDFAEELALMSETHLSDLHLEKIYEIIDNNGVHILYKRLDSSLIDRYLSSKVHNSYYWIRMCKLTLSSFFKYLYRNYDFPNLMLQTKFFIKAPTSTKNNLVLSRSQVIKFMNSVVSNSNNLNQDSLLFILLLSTGSRISEVIGIRVEQIDTENELIFIKKTKNKSSKNIVLRTGIGPVLEKYIEMNKLKKDSFLFNLNGKKLNHTYVQGLFHSYLKKASLPLTNLHSLRKSFATLMAESGTNITVIQQLLNHKSLNTTKIYVDSNYIRNMGIKIEENRLLYQKIRR
jgi:integrase